MLASPLASQTCPGEYVLLDGTPMDQVIAYWSLGVEIELCKGLEDKKVADEVAACDWSVK